MNAPLVTTREGLAGKIRERHPAQRITMQWKKRGHDNLSPFILLECSAENCSVLGQILISPTGQVWESDPTTGNTRIYGFRVALPLMAQLSRMINDNEVGNLT